MTPTATPSPSPARRGHPAAPPPFGDHLRRWRQQRRLSQLELAHEAGVSTRHLSCVETGRATPSREMVMRLSARLEVPLRERNAMLVAAGFAPMYRQHGLDDPAMRPAREAVQRVLKGHEPYPALAVDRHWQMVAANGVVPLLLQGVAPELLQPPVNVLRLSLHPGGLAPRIANLGQWRAHLFERLRQQIAACGDAVLATLLDELQALPAPDDGHGAPDAGADGVGGLVVPLALRTPAGTLNFISTTTVFGSPVDVTLQELAIESFFPADAATAEALAGLAAAPA